jgi:hypothetical protein
MERRDPDEVLGVSRCAGRDEIRRAYRRLARQLHPDASGDPATAAAFTQATEAYHELRRGGPGGGVPVSVTVAPPRPRARRPSRAAPPAEPLDASRPGAEPLVPERPSWRWTEAQDLAAELEISPELELVLRLLRAGFFPW